MSNGKGNGPRKGYNYQKYAENYDQIFRTMKPNQEESTMTTKQPAPVLAWHREAAICIMGLNYPPGDAVTNIAHIIAVHHWSHDTHAETVRLLEEAMEEIESFGTDTFSDRIRAHLAKLKGTQ